MPGAIGIVNRTPARAEALAETYAARAWPCDQLEEALGQADIVLSCTSAPEVVIDAPMVARALEARTTAEQGLLLLDLAVPRDIDREAAALRGVRLFDIDDMRVICEANRAARVAEMGTNGR